MMKLYFLKTSLVTIARPTDRTFKIKHNVITMVRQIDRTMLIGN